MSKIIYKQMDKSDSLNEFITTLLQQYDLNEAHITVEKRKPLFYVKASIGRYVVAKKDSDVYLLVDKVISILHKQIREYERKQFDIHKRLKKEVYSDEPIQKIKKFIIKPMNRNNALEHMQLLGHTFYLYINEEEHNKPSLLFEKDGEVFSQTSFEQVKIEDAYLEMANTPSLEYYAFIDIDTDVLTVIYRRKNDTIGIIDASL